MATARTLAARVIAADTAYDTALKARVRAAVAVVIDNVYNSESVCWIYDSNGATPKAQQKGWFSGGGPSSSLSSRGRRCKLECAIDTAAAFDALYTTGATDAVKRKFTTGYAEQVAAGVSLELKNNDNRFWTYSMPGNMMTGYHFAATVTICFEY